MVLLAGLKEDPLTGWLLEQWISRRAGKAAMYGAEPGQN